MQKPTKHKGHFHFFFEVLTRDNRSIFTEYSNNVLETLLRRCLRSIVVVRSLRKRKVASSILAEGCEKFCLISYFSSWLHCCCLINYQLLLLLQPLKSWSYNIVPPNRENLPATSFKKRYHQFKLVTRSRHRLIHQRGDWHFTVYFLNLKVSSTSFWN